MCLIIACDKNRPDLEVLTKAICQNGDGTGVAWFGKSKAEYVKGLKTAEEVHAFIQKIPFPFVIHSRLSSEIGQRDNLLLNHPYEITKDSQLRLSGSAKKLLFHNGTIKEYNLILAIANIQVADNLLMNDTRAISLILAKNGNEKLLSQLDGKYVVMDSSKREIKLYGEFKEDYEDKNKGMVFSNTSWKWNNDYSKKSYYPYAHYAGDYTAGLDDWDARTYVGLKNDNKELERKQLENKAEIKVTRGQLPGVNVKLSRKDKKKIRRKAYLLSLQETYGVNKNQIYYPDNTKDLVELSEKDLEMLPIKRLHELPDKFFNNPLMNKDKMCKTAKQVLGIYDDIDVHNILI